MFKRLFFAMLGLGAGVALGVLAVRRLEQIQRRLSPDQLAAAAAGHAGSLQERLAAAVAAGKAAAAEKEAELRRVYGGEAPPPV